MLPDAGSLRNILMEFPREAKREIAIFGKLRYIS